MMEGFVMYQIIVILISSIMISRTLILMIRRKKSIRELFLSIIVWGVFALLATLPEISQKIADVTGFEVGINALLVCTTFLNFLFLIILSSKIDSFQVSLTKLVREQALEQFKIQSKHAQRKRK